LNRSHLRARLIESKYIPEDAECSMDEIREMLCNRFDSIDYSQAKLDVAPFIRDTTSLNVWSTDFFKQITAGLSEV